jgi:hypothetical protein
MDEDRRQRLIEMLLLIGSMIGIFLAVFQMSSYVFIIFSIFIFFSIIYYITSLENSKKTSHNIFVTFMVSISFSSLFVILLARGINANDMVQLAVMTVVYGFLAFILTIELSGYCIDVHVAKKEEGKKPSSDKHS